MIKEGQRGGMRQMLDSPQVCGPRLVLNRRQNGGPHQGCRCGLSHKP